MLDGTSSDLGSVCETMDASAVPVLFRDLPCSILITDNDVANGGPFIRYANPAFEAMTGWSLAEIQGENPRFLQGPLTDPSVIDGLRKALRARRQWTGSTWNYRRNGEAFVMSWMISPYSEGWIAVQLELPSLMADQSIFSDEPIMAFGFDAQTRLLSYSHFLKLLESRLSAAPETVTVAHIDIDGFFAATAGKPEAEMDALIREIGARLAAIPGVEALARADADHYYGLLNEPEAARDLSGAFADVFGDPLRPIRLSATIGAAVAGRSGERTLTLCHAAQLAVRRGKMDGKRRLVWHEPGMTADLQRRHDIERRLRRALDNTELSVAYQPKLNLKTGRIDSAEVLARWRDPVSGPVSPADFIAVAETSGMIAEVSEQVLALALSDLARLDTAKRPFSIAFNVSGYQLDEHSAEAFFNHLNACAARFGIAPQQVEIEITESKFLDPNISWVTEMLKKQGFKISIDDFGKEYSNLLQVTKINADAVKIDKSLIDFCEENERTRCVIKSIVSMSTDLGMSVVAEGVETSGQLNILRGLGCNAAQGYFISKPLDSIESAFRKSDSEDV